MRRGGMKSCEAHRAERDAECAAAGHDPRKNPQDSRPLTAGVSETVRRSFGPLAKDDIGSRVLFGHGRINVLQAGGLRGVARAVCFHKHEARVSLRLRASRRTGGGRQAIPST
jgi:hypothetical protein